MNTRYVTKEEFDEYLADLIATMDNYDRMFSSAIEAIKNLSTTINEQEECLTYHDELFKHYSQTGGAIRFLDWTGSGNFADPVNIGISLSYDKANRGVHHRKSLKSKNEPGCGCMTLILVLVSILLIAGLSIIII